MALVFLGNDTRASVGRGPARGSGVPRRSSDLARRSGALVFDDAKLLGLGEFRAHGADLAALLLPPCGRGLASSAVLPCALGHDQQERIALAAHRDQAGDFAVPKNADPGPLNRDRVRHCRRGPGWGVIWVLWLRRQPHGRPTTQ